MPVPGLASWSDLPPELQEVVLRKTGMDMIPHLRLVCKAWAARPMGSVKARTGANATKLLRCISGLQRTPSRLNFSALVALDISSFAASAEKHMEAALRALPRLKYLTLGWLQYGHAEVGDPATHARMPPPLPDPLLTLPPA